MPLIRKASASLPLSPDDPILIVASRMEGKIRDAFLAAVEAVKSQVTLSQVEAAIRANDYNKVVALLDIENKFSQALSGVGLAAGTQSVRDALQATYGAAAQAASIALPPKVGTQLSFDLLNPESVKFLQEYTFELIQQVTQETRTAIQQIITRAFQEGGHPYEQAREIREVIGLTARMEQAVANYRQALESGSATDLQAALQRALRDGRYDRTLLRAMRDGKGLTPAQIDAMVDRYRQRYLTYRARNIARSESLRASNAGQLALWKTAIQQGLIPATARRKWTVSGDERTCLRCLALDGTTAGLDEPFDAEGDPVMQPPAHPSCRCSQTLVAASLKAPARANAA